MSLVYADQVKETSTTTGTASLTLLGAVLGFRTFLSAIGLSNECFYAARNFLTGEWENGLGTVGAGILTRDTVLSGSNGTSLVNFTSGVKEVYVTMVADALPTGFDIRAFGASTTATPSVNTAAIARGIAKVPLGSKLIVPPVGIFQIASQFELNRGITLEGGGKGSAIQQLSASVQNVGRITASDAEIKNLRLIGNGVTGTTPSANVLYVETSDDVLLSRLWIENGSLTGIQLNGTINRATLRGIKVTGTNPSSANSNSSDIYLNGGVIADCDFVGLRLLSTLKNMGVLCQTGNGGTGDRQYRNKFKRCRTRYAKIVGTSGGHGFLLYLNDTATMFLDVSFEDCYAEDTDCMGFYVRGLATVPGNIVGTTLRGCHAIRPVLVGTSGTLEDAGFAVTNALGTDHDGCFVRGDGADPSTASAFRAVDNAHGTKWRGCDFRSWTARGYYIGGGTVSQPQRCIASDGTSEGGSIGMLVHGSDHLIHHMQFKDTTADSVQVQADAVDVTVDTIRATGSANGGIHTLTGATRTKLFNNDVSGNSVGINDQGTGTVRRGNRISTGATQGKAVLVAGTVTVSTIEVEAGDTILVTRDVAGGTRGNLTIGTKTAGTGFVIRSEDAAGALVADTSTVSYQIVH